MICNLCNKEINESNEKYTHVEDFSSNKKVSEFWCHLECFKKAMNRDLTTLELQAKEMLATAGNIFNKIMPEKEYTIR